MKEKIMALMVVLGLVCSTGLVSGASDGGTNTANVTVNSYMDVTFSYSTVDFGTVGNTDFGGNVTMTQSESEMDASVDTNQDWQLEVASTQDFYSEWGVENLAVDVGKSTGDVSPSTTEYLPVNSGSRVLVSESPTTVGDGDFNHFFSYTLFVPSDVVEGSHTAGFDLIYSNTA